MSDLKRFSSKPRLSQAFLNSKSPDPEAEFEVEDMDTKLPIDLMNIRGVLNEAMNKVKDGGTRLDVHTAIELHRALPLTRSEAADMHMWWWIAAGYAPDYVASRFYNNKNGEVKIDRYLGSRVRNTFARLWWAAELTSTEGDYVLTEAYLNLSGFQDLNEAISGRLFANYFPAVSAFIEVVGASDEGTIRETAKGFNAMLSTVVLEDFSAEELSEEIKWLVDRV